MTTGLNVFDTSLQKTNEILRSIEEELGWSDDLRHQTYQAVRAVLHALRDRLTIDESAHLAAQLPLILRGVYYDGWKPSEVPVKMKREEFVDLVACQVTYQVEGGYESLISIVLDKVFETIDPGEANKIIGTLPDDIASFFA